ncbi:MAG: hypothetical protein LUB56_01880 [Coprobacillus sp.]|nr:hypothetical protein [Coprobacillus sp.]
MKITLSKKDIEEFNKLVDTKEVNLSVADMLNEMYADGFYIDFDGIEDENESDYVYETMMDYYQIDLEDEENNSLAEHYFHEQLHKKNVSEYEGNPYNKLAIPEVKKGNLELKYLHYEPYEPFPLDEIKVNKDHYYEELSQIGYFDKEYRYLALIDKDVIWMSINPNEIETMKAMIEEANGNVLICGLGLGYLAYMLSLKDEVKSVVILENNKDIISIFNENIYPLLKTKSKIKILYQDAFVYLKEEAISKKYNYVYVDLWHDANEGLPMYLRLLPIEEKCKNVVFHYWLEPSMIALARRCLITLLFEQINKLDVDYSKHENFTDILINNLYTYLLDKEISSYRDIDEMLSDEEIKKLLIGVMTK